jgi:hypothetical protein
MTGRQAKLIGEAINRSVRVELRDLDEFRPSLSRWSPEIVEARIRRLAALVGRPTPRSDTVRGATAVRRAVSPTAPQIMPRASSDGADNRLLLARRSVVLRDVSPVIRGVVMRSGFMSNQRGTAVYLEDMKLSENAQLGDSGACRRR